MKSKYLWLGTSLVLVSACAPKSESRLKEAWNAANNPSKMMVVPEEFETNFDKLPTEGLPSKMPWSDHYWPTYHGGITYRWNDIKSKQLSYLIANTPGLTLAGQLDNEVELQKARSEVLGYTPFSKEHLEAMGERQRTALIATLSPAEKLDIYRGAYDYPTVKSERERTEIFSTLRTLPNEDANEFKPNPSYKEGYKIPLWYGICHAWAPATIHFYEPGPLTVKSKDGFEVRWAASDIKALLSHIIDVRASQQRSRGFMGERCNNDMGESAKRLLRSLIDGVEMGKLSSIEKQVDALIEADLFDYPTTLTVASYFYNYASTQEEAKLAFQELFERMQTRLSSGSSVREKMKLAYESSLSNFPDAGTPNKLDVNRLKADAMKSVDIPACRDTNAGAFHLVLTNLMGLQKKSFGVDVTRDAEVWNQAAAKYSSVVKNTFTGSQISKGASVGTEKEVLIETRFFYTTEEAPAWNRFGDNLTPQRHHIQAGDIIPGTGYDANHDGDFNDEGDTPPDRAYEYRLELNGDNTVIGGSWVSKERPDFLWNDGNFLWGSDFSDIKKLYVLSLKN